MNHLNKAIHMILRGENDKFSNILYESLIQRATEVIEKEYHKISSDLIDSIFEPPVPSESINEAVIFSNVEIKSVYTTKDGNTVHLTEEQIDSISKLYKKLNNNNQERMLKLLSESEQSINRIIKLAKIEGNKHVK